MTRPPYTITAPILKLISSVSEKLGAVNARYLNRQTPQLRKQNKIKTIHASLQIEGNTLSLEQVTAILEKKRVLGPKKDIREVLNAVKVYDKLRAFNPSSEKHFLFAHRILMKGLIPDAGGYRKQSVGIAKGANVAHVAPPYKNVPYLMKDLFNYLKNDEEVSLIKSCVFHYEMEFIHPFMDGNGRMGRLWQTLILMGEYPAFEFLPVETLISKNQKEYYRALAASDKKGNSTVFIEYMLSILNNSLTELLDYNARVLTETDRLEYFTGEGKKEFSRKEYMDLFKEMSTATASRDLKKGIELGLLTKSGDKKTTRYRVARK